MRAIISVLIFAFATHCFAISKTIKIGTEGAYEPFNYIDPQGKLLGFDIDIAREICKEMKVECQFVTQSWDGIIPGLLLGKYDAIVASMSITEQRKKKVLFTDSYYSTPAKFAVKTGTTLDVSKAGLKGKTVGVQRGTIHQNYLEGEFKGIVDLKLYTTQEDANFDLISGRLDAVLADSAVLYGWIEKKAKGKLAFTGPDIKDEKYFGAGAGIALRKKDTELQLAMNKAIKTVKENGSYDRIQKKYFPFDIK